MADDLSVAIERLRTSTQRLNEVCDSAAQIIRDVESFLEESRVGVEAKVSLGFGASSPNAEDPDWQDYLSYCRVSSGRFRISRVRTYLDDPPGREDDVRPWSECTRTEKLASFELLPDLLRELSKRVDDRTDLAQRVVSEIASHLHLPKKRKGG